MTKKLLKFTAISAIINAVVFFAYSIINLVMFAIQQNAIAPFQSGIVSFLVSNLKPILAGTNLIIFLTALIIYASFSKLASQSKVKALPYSAYFVILSMLLLSLVMFASIFSISSLKLLSDIGIQNIEAVVGLSFTIFGILLIPLRKSIKESILPALGVLYIIQGFSLISSLALPLRLVDFTIAARILESVLFFTLAKSK